MAKRDYWVTVCDKCLQASCWHGEFMCDEAQNAGTVDKLASELRRISTEHPSWYSRERLVEIIGDVREAHDD